MFTQAVSAGVFAELYDMDTDRNNPAEIVVAKDRKIPNEIVTPSRKNLVLFKKTVFVYFLQIFIQCSSSTSTLIYIDRHRLSEVSTLTGCNVFIFKNSLEKFLMV